MTTRTFRQKGIAFGNETANITAKIDNVVVYQGSVTTLNEPYPALPNLDYQVDNELFSWTADVAFSGPQVIEITTSGNSILLITALDQNYCPIANGNVIVSSGANGFMDLKWEQFGNTYINGVLQSSGTINHDTLGGQWWWKIAPNSSFVENVSIEPGQD